MASSIPPPPPPPPLPSLVQLTPKTLAPSQRPPANRNGVGSVRPTENPSNRSLLANIHPETLQHAAKHLRKTKHSESLFTPQSEQLLERPPELPSGGYRPNFEKHDQLELNQTGATIYASSLGPDSSLPKYNGKLDSNSLSKSLQTSSPAPLTAPAPTTTPSRWTTPYGQPLFYSKPLNVNNSSTVTNNNNNNYSTYSSSSSTTYYPPPSQQQQQPQVTGYSYSYSSNANSNDTPTSAPPDYPPPPPPPATITPTKADPVNLQQPSSNYYSSYSSSTTTNSVTPQQPSYNTGTNNSSPYISNPQSYIHEFATKTPVAQIDPTLSSNAQVSATPPRQKPYSFVEELRDSTLTDRQKYANQFQRTNLPERLPPQAVAHIYQETTADTERQLSQRRQQQQQQQQQQQSPFQSSKIDEVDELIKTMEWRMQTGNTNDICSKCQKEIVGDTPGVTALGKPYHVTCFTCDQCQKQLAGCSFYSVDGKNLCQVDYMNSLDKCDKCATPITQKILRAMGKAFHPECFACPSCTKSLDGIPFTVDPQGTPYCLDCYHDRFSPRCAVCLKAIVPQAGETEVARIVAMDRSYHLACYKCEDCGLQLNSKIEGQGCYPLESHLFCKNCNLKRLKAMH